MNLKRTSTRAALGFGILAVLGIVARIVGPFLGPDSYVGRDMVIFGLALAVIGVVGATISLVVGVVRSSSAQATATAPAWYPDPHDANLLRYHDGGTWTQHTAPREAGR